MSRPRPNTTPKPINISLLLPLSSSAIPRLRPSSRPPSASTHSGGGGRTTADGVALTVQTSRDKLFEWWPCPPHARIPTGALVGSRDVCGGSDRVVATRNPPPHAPTPNEKNVGSPSAHHEPAPRDDESCRRFRCYDVPCLYSKFVSFTVTLPAAHAPRLSCSVVQCLYRRTAAARCVSLRPRVRGQTGRRVGPRRATTRRSDRRALLASS